MPQMKGLTAICSGMAGYTTYGVISAERRKAICDFLCANGPYVTPATSNNLCRRTIRANALMVCAASLQAGVTRFVLLAYGMKQPLSSLRPLMQVQAPTAIMPNRLDLGVTYDGNGGIPLFFSNGRGVSHILNAAHGRVWPRVFDEGCEGKGLRSLR